MAILSKACKPDSFESHNSLKLSFTNIRGLRSNFVDSESFLESNSLDSHALLIQTCNLSVGGYLPLIRKNFITHIHGLAVYMKKGLSFARELSLQNSVDSYLCFEWLYFPQCLTSFSYIDHLLRLYARFFMLFYLTQIRFS